MGHARQLDLIIDDGENHTIPQVRVVCTQLLLSSLSSWPSSIAAEQIITLFTS